MTPAVQFGIIGAGLIALGLPLIRQWVPPNRFYGVRVPPTMRSPRVWYEANRRAGWDMVVAGAVIVASSIGLSGSSVALQTSALAAVTVVVLLGAAAKGILAAYRLERTDSRQ